MSDSTFVDPPCVTPSATVAESSRAPTAPPGARSRRAGKPSDRRQLVVRDVSSRTKLVCRPESSVPTNLTVTVLPEKAETLNDFWTYEAFLLRLEYVARVLVVPPDTIWTLSLS